MSRNGAVRPSHVGASTYSPPVPREGSFDAWPLLGTHQDLPAFIVRTRQRSLVAGLVFNLVLAGSAFALALAARSPFVAVAGVFFTYLTAVTARSLRRGAAVYLTSRGISVIDGGGSLSARWRDVTVRPSVRRGRVVALHLEVPSGLLKSEGGARTWKRINTALDADHFVLHPALYEHGRHLARLLDWCELSEHHQVIGFAAGRRRFHESVSESTSP
jgi:hypothetical protein